MKFKVLTGAAALVTLGLFGCGGGGGGGGAGAVPAPVPMPTPTPTPTPTPLPAVDVSAVAKQDPGSTLPENWQGGAIMEIYVRAYQDSNGDGIGDLKGVIQRLDYLKDLGVRGIWLMPITRSQDHDHGYAVTDYRAIEPDYGTLADFDELLAQAHARGIGVVFDYVMNHSAAEHPLFVNAKAGASNPYRSWYVWQQTAPAGWSLYGTNPWRVAASGYYYAGFWDQMPDFNLRNPDVVAWHKDNLRFWLNRGVDGVRFDAVGNLIENGPSGLIDQPENYPLMADIHAVISSYQRRFMVCEGPDDPLGFGKPDVCGSAFAFKHQSDLIAAAKGDTAAIARVASYFPAAPAGMSTLLSNHDGFAGARPWNQFNGNLSQYRLAAATYLLQPGTPFIYYGEEVGMGAAPLSDDAGLRAPMSWSASTANAGFTTGQPFRATATNVASYNVAAESSDPNSLLAFYKALLALRNSRVSIARGSYEGAVANGTVLSFRRRLGDETTLVVINYGGSAAAVGVGGLGAGARLTALYPSGAAAAVADAGGQVSLNAGAASVLVYAVQ